MGSESVYGKWRGIDLHWREPPTQAAIERERERDKLVLCIHFYGNTRVKALFVTQTSALHNRPVLCSFDRTVMRSTDIACVSCWYVGICVRMWQSPNLHFPIKDALLPVNARVHRQTAVYLLCKHSGAEKTRLRMWKSSTLKGGNVKMKKRFIM